jgi:hypothetical protein
MEIKIRLYRIAFYSPSHNRRLISACVDKVLGDTTGKCRAQLNIRSPTCSQRVPLQHVSTSRPNGFAGSKCRMMCRGH